MKEAEAAANEERGLDGEGGGWGIDKSGKHEEKTNMSGAGHGEMLDCSAAAFCTGLQTLSVDLYSTSIGVGMPFFIAGVVLFCGCFVTLKGCCCHRSLPPKDSRVNEYVDG